MKGLSVFVLIYVANGLSLDKVLKNSDVLECHGKEFKNVTLAAYYPDYDEDFEEGFMDVRGKKLRTLQDYLDDRTDFVTLAMDQELSLPYGTPVCIPELNKHFGRRLNIQVRDVGIDLRGKKYSRADICVRAEPDSYDCAVNRMVTIIF